MAMEVPSPDFYSAAPAGSGILISLGLLALSVLVAVAVRVPRRA